MRPKRWLALWCGIAFSCGTTIAQESYKFLNEIPIGGEGGWDILTIDSAASRFYLSHATKVVVVDLITDTVAGEIADTPGVHGFVAIPEVQRGFSSNGKESKSSVVDLTTLKTTSKIDTGPNPDAVVYEPRHGEVYVFNHIGNSVTVINAKAATVSATVPIGAGVDGCAFDDARQLAFASCGDGTTTIAREVTPEKLTVIQTLKTERGSRTMALDPKTHRIYLPSAKFEPAPSPSPGMSPARPRIVPNTLKLLVYSPGEPLKD